MRRLFTYLERQHDKATLEALRPMQMRALFAQALSLAEAARPSGYTAEHLGQLVRSDYRPTVLVLGLVTVSLFAVHPMSAAAPPTSASCRGPGRAIVPTR